MIIYHATTPKKAAKYHASGQINKPVRGFDTIGGAFIWALHTGRTVIYKVETDDLPVYKLPDHHNEKGDARWVDGDVPLKRIKAMRAKNLNISEGGQTNV